MRIYRELKIRLADEVILRPYKFVIHEVGPGAVVGEELFYNKDKYKYTVKVESVSCTLLLFEKNLNVRDFSNTFLANSFRESFKEKDEMRQKVLENIERNNPERFLLAKYFKPTNEDVIDDMKNQIKGTVFIMQMIQIFCIILS